MSNVEFEAVIGLEVHAQLATQSKIFAPSATKAGEPPNTLTDPVTLGLPGSLPVLNRTAVEFAIRLGLATESNIHRESIFARKHYLYPDLPKGYQISQYEKPICTKGKIQIRLNGQVKDIGLTRIHLEEDAGKNIHHADEPYSTVDLNRAGVPLVEIVSEPDIRSADEAGAYMRRIRQIVRYLDICDGNMEEGSLRCDANVSVRPVGATEFGQKVEIKNINSFRFVEKAIEFEIDRQIRAVKQGEAINQETRLWDENKNETRVMRTKEFAADYRYFPDPDLLPLVVDESWIQRVRTTLPELPHQAFERFRSMYGLDDYNAEILTQERLVASYYDQAVSTHNNPQAIANWLTTELFGRLNKDSIPMSSCPVSPENLAELVKLIDEGTISGKIGKTVFDEMFAQGSSPQSIIEQKGLRQISNPGEIRAVIDAVLDSSPTQLADYFAGKTRMQGYFVGEVMKRTQGRANPQLVNDILAEALAARQK